MFDKPNLTYLYSTLHIVIMEHRFLVIHLFIFSHYKPKSRFNKKWEINFYILSYYSGITLGIKARKASDTWNTLCMTSILLNNHGLLNKSWGISEFIEAGANDNTTCQSNNLANAFLRVYR